jgi:hypothetical protein
MSGLLSKSRAKLLRPGVPKRYQKINGPVPMMAAEYARVRQGKNCSSP